MRRPCGLHSHPYLERERASMGLRVGGGPAPCRQEAWPRSALAPLPLLAPLRSAFAFPPKTATAQQDSEGKGSAPSGLSPSLMSEWPLRGEMWPGQRRCATPPKAQEGDMSEGADAPFLCSLAEPRPPTSSAVAALRRPRRRKRRRSTPPGPRQGGERRGRRLAHRASGSDEAPDTLSLISRSRPELGVSAVGGSPPHAAVGEAERRGVAAGCDRLHRRLGHGRRCRIPRLPGYLAQPFTAPKVSPLTM
jgi:hypothetical protein